MIDCAVATQTNGVAEVLYASMNAWILIRGFHRDPQGEGRRER